MSTHPDPNLSTSHYAHPPVNPYAMPYPPGAYPPHGYPPVPGYGTPYPFGYPGYAPPPPHHPFGPPASNRGEEREKKREEHSDEEDDGRRRHGRSKKREEYSDEEDDGRRRNERSKKREEYSDEEERGRRRERSNKREEYSDEDDGRRRHERSKQRREYSDDEDDRSPPPRDQRRSRKETGDRSDDSERDYRPSRSSLRPRPSHYGSHQRDLSPIPRGFSPTGSSHYSSCLTHQRASSPIPRGFRRAELLQRAVSREVSPIPRGFRKMDEERGRIDRPAPSPSSEDQRRYRLSLLDRSSESPRRAKGGRDRERSPDEQAVRRVPLRVPSLPRRSRSSSPDYWAMADEHERGSKQWLRMMILSVLNAYSTVKTEDKNVKMVTVDHLSRLLRSYDRGRVCTKGDHFNDPIDVLGYTDDISWLDFLREMRDEGLLRIHAVGITNRKEYNAATLDHATLAQNSKTIWAIYAPHDKEVASFVDKREFLN